MELEKLDKESGTSKGIRMHQKIRKSSWYRKKSEKRTRRGNKSQFESRSKRNNWSTKKKGRVNRWNRHRQRQRYR